MVGWLFRWISLPLLLGELFLVLPLNLSWERVGRLFAYTFGIRGVVL